MQFPVCIVLLASTLLSTASAGYAVANVDFGTDVNPIKKVVTLIEEMKAQVSKEAEEDKVATEKYGCWCETNNKAKTETVELAIKKVAELEAYIEEAAGLKGQLKTEIAQLEEDIAADQDSLDKATKLKEEETANFNAESKDTKETIEALTQALEVLAKVQLLQKKGAHTEAKPLLLQLKGVVAGLHVRLGGEFRSVMQQDLWDVMSSIDSASGGSEFLGSRSLEMYEQQGRVSQGAVQPNELEGNAAGAKSYNSRSGSIYGMLAEMKDEFSRNLAAAQKSELEAMIVFQRLRSSKLAEIKAATTSKDDKEKTLADTEVKAAQAAEDLEATKEALTADQQFLLGLAKSCKENEEEYAKRVAVRSDELKALAETIKILTSDDARDLFGKTMSFLQVSNVGAQKGMSDSQNQAVNSAFKRILKVARKHQNWVLASLAVRVRLDGFTKVKEAMDKMLAELKEQQKAEAKKRDFCNGEIDSTEDSIKTKEQEKEDLEGTKLGLENQVASLDASLKELKSEVADLQVSLKQAGEDRKAENTVFQQSVADQRATINILQKAKARLAKFYSQGSFVQKKQPGQAVAPEPEKAKDYSKSAGAGGVLQLLDMIMSDASTAESELITGENYAQEDYMTLVQDINTSIEAHSTAITEKTKLREQAMADKSEAKGALLATGEELTKLDEVLKGMHLDCDYLLKYYQVRQDARAEEMNAIVEAKAILSGADFGKEQ